MVRGPALSSYRPLRSRAAFPIAMFREITAWTDWFIKAQIGGPLLEANRKTFALSELFRFRPWLCKNSAGYNRTRNFGLYGHAESKKTQKFVFRSALRPNQISFSHDQGRVGM
jgi:hypothetical protein